MTEDQFIEITKWQDKTFPKATTQSALYHLKEEIDELWDALILGTPKKNLEWADNFLLLFGAAHKDGMTYKDICNSIEEKMKINREREWVNIDKNGVVHHTKTNT